jgi:hypothetical protein
MATGKQKIATRIWIPLLDKFEKRINSACLRRDAYLTKVLEHELDRLEDAARFCGDSNSEAARQFIASRLDALPRKLVTLTLPEALVQRLDDLCDRKRIVRDSFFNRLFFLLAADREHRTRLFFEGDWTWLQALLEHTDFASSAAGEFLDAIPDFRDPFYAIRATRDLPDYQGPDPIYIAPITPETFVGVDLSGLNVYLPDDQVPGTAEHDRFSRVFDDLLKDPATDKEEPNP